MNDKHDTEEAQRILSAYARRRSSYDPVEPWVLAVRQERERGLARWIREDIRRDARCLHLVELGCGDGANLLDFVRLGFDPAKLAGVDLIDSRIAAARVRLPASVRLYAGDAAMVPLERARYDVVFQSMMCTSILDDGMLHRIATRMWELVAPGGGVLWYDFCYDNWRNPDVRGIPVRTVKKLFPAAAMRVRRLTLAPPISRVVTRVHPVLYPILNVLPLLRTHALCWIPRPGNC